MKVFERVEGEAADGGSVGQCAQEFGQRIGNTRFCTAAVHGDSHVLLGIAEEREVCGAIGGEADEDFARSWSS